VSPGKSCTLHTCFLLISNVREPDDHPERKLRLELEKTSMDRSEEQKIRVMIGRESKRCIHSILRIISVNLNSTTMQSGVLLLTQTQLWASRGDQSRLKHTTGLKSPYEF
jgi:hypothetical protein